MNTIIRKFEISNEQLSSLIVTALEGGVNYWCIECSVMYPRDPKTHKPVDMRPSDIVEKFDAWSLAFKEEETDEYKYMDKNKFLNGISKAMDWGGFTDVEDLLNNHDAETADVIIQFAIFGEIVYG